jgi:exopolysaccharide biosynthesis polyprenyl glycosylphosphotransferase
MAQILPRSKYLIGWLLVIPTIAWFYMGLFLTMTLWYPAGVSADQWQSHLLNFSIVYVLWLAIFFSYRLFEWQSLRATQSYIGRLIAALLICLVLAALYFYFQPALLITPRRFLLVHLLITGLGIILWYFLIRRAASRGTQRDVFIHSAVESMMAEVQALIKDNQVLGLRFAGTLQPGQALEFSEGTIIVMPARSEIDPAEISTLFALRNQGVKFVEYHSLHEILTRTVHLSALSDLWFIDSIDYGTRRLFDIIKRIIDIILGLMGTTVFLISYPILGTLIKLTSPGPVLFTQDRVGQQGKPFALYKYRSMSGGASNTWTAPSDSRITRFGRFLRATRLDELPQSLNILKGDMSIVGPRPEQVNIVAQLRQEIPYYDERHIVKPGLTGWAQLYVYAATVEESKRKLQYDLYYIKHRSLLFDVEIILKTIYNIITFAGR